MMTLGIRVCLDNVYLWSKGNGLWPELHMDGKGSAVLIEVNLILQEAIAYVALAFPCQRLYGEFWLCVSAATGVKPCI